MAESLSPNKRVLFFVPYGGWQVHNQLDAIVATALRMRGAEVAILTCDGLFRERCYVLSGTKTPNEDCKVCTQKGQSLFKAFNLPVLQLRDFLNTEDHEFSEKWSNSLAPDAYSAAHYEGYPFGKWVAPPVCGYHVTNVKGLNDPDVRETHRKYLKYAVLVHRAAKRVFDQFNPTHVVPFSGIGFLHRIVYNLAEEKGLNIMTHEGSYLPGTFMVADNDFVVGAGPRKKVIQEWSSIPLKADEFSKTKQLFVDWENSRNRGSSLFYNYNTEHTQVRKKLGIPEDARILTVFTNSEHESLYIDEWRDVERQLEIIQNLIDIFAKRDDYLIIRHHPNICRLDHPRPDYEFMTRAYQQAMKTNSNVRIIMPLEKITSYSLLWNSDATLAFVSTLGVESAARAIPCASLKVSNYNAATSHTVSDFSYEGLEKLVDNLFEKNSNYTPEDLRKPYRLIHAQCYHFAITFSSFGVRNRVEPEIKITKAEDLLPGNDIALDRICDHILTGSSIYDLPSGSHKNTSDSEEVTLLSNELEVLKQYRKEVREKSKSEPRNISTPNFSVLNITKSASSELSRPSWLSAQRYEKINYSETVIRNNQPWRDYIAALATSVEKCTDELILITDKHFWYDESLLSWSNELIQGDANISGIRWGAWLLDQDQSISTSFFIEHVSGISLGDACKKAPFLADPFKLLACCVFKVNALKDLLKAASSSSNAEEAFNLISKAISSESFKQMGVPMLLASEAGFDFKQVEQNKRVPNTQILVNENLNLPQDDIMLKIEKAIGMLERNENLAGLRALREVMPLKNDMPMLYYAKAVAETRLGIKNDAIESLKNFLALEPNNQKGIELLDLLTKNP